MSKPVDYARERLESFERGERGPYHGFNRDLRLVLNALRDAEKRLEQFEECQLDSDGFCTDENCNRHD